MTNNIQTKTLSTRHYKAGYEIRTEEWKVFDDDEPTLMKAAYTPEGEFIGNSKDAYRLCAKRGIKPEFRTPDSNVCSIGFSERDQKWYGWSHRAIYGFGIGSSVKRGDCAYTPSDVDELVEKYSSWNDYVRIINSNTIRAFNKMYAAVGERDDGSLIMSASANPDYYDANTGRGEWVAATLDDAREMACAFASSVA